MSSFTDHLASLIERGGWVMLPLLVLSIVSVTLIIERIVFWVTMHSSRKLARLARLNDALRKGDRPTAGKMVSGSRTPYGVIANRLLSDGASEAIAIEAIDNQRPRVERFMVSLSTIITAAPLLGILGTVIGIIRSFNLLGDQGTLTDPRTVSAGIAEALLTTALGLIIALVTLFPYMVFRGQVDRTMGRLESLIAAAQQGFRAKSEQSSDGVHVSRSKARPEQVLQEVPSESK